MLVDGLAATVLATTSGMSGRGTDGAGVEAGPLAPEEVAGTVAGTCFPFRSLRGAIGQLVLCFCTPYIRTSNIVVSIKYLLHPTHRDL